MHIKWNEWLSLTNDDGKGEQQYKVWVEWINVGDLGFNWIVEIDK